MEEELKVELTCKAERLEETIDKIISVHPYEEPVIQVLPLYMTGIKRTTNDDNWCQLRFDDNLNIVAERIHREMSLEAKKAAAIKSIKLQAKEKIKEVKILYATNPQLKQAAALEKEQKKAACPSPSS